MSDLIETLRQLQAVDSELYRLRNDRKRKPLELEQARQELAEQEAKAKAAEAHLKGLQIKQKEKELELSQREATTRKLQAQLFQVKTNKEYTAIQHEIDQSKADASLFEEDIIRLLDEIDQANREHKTQLGALEQQRGQLQQEETRIATAIAVIEEEIAQLERQRQTITPLVDRTALSVYERVLVSREGLALVPLVKDSCGGCHMVQRPQALNEVYLRAQLVTCENCNRILYAQDAYSGETSPAR